jgi:hypothetical protein
MIFIVVQVRDNDRFKVLGLDRKMTLEWRSVLRAVMYGQFYKMPVFLDQLN